MLTMQAKKAVNKVINEFLMQAMQDGFVLEATEIQNEEWGGIMNLQKEATKQYKAQFAIVHYFEGNNKIYGHHVKVDYEQGIYGHQVDVDCEQEYKQSGRSYKKHRIVRLKKYDDAEEKFQELLHGDK